ncbi:flagellar export chaperone FliS [Chitinimonas koreensis]|uniref:flagellar export chaperone FliS n=1 Tax=Chitinimonas koreensis TaxID=356302 RepID=UPI0004175E37|nr:flagellar export chaperone FliS [Chitinimonas koreensis]QNM98506.1 flagellar export chaperone FliS [Chitinimonas koreensis]
MANANIRKALNSYDQGGVEQLVDTASPHKLICMLYEGALKAVMMARFHMQNNEVAAKGAAISKAISIIEEGLRVSLDKGGAGGELAGNLDALYEYMSSRLLLANLRNDMVALDEVQGLMSQLRDAWVAIDQPQAAAATGTGTGTGAAPEQRNSPLSYGRV